MTDDAKVEPLRVPTCLVYKGEAVFDNGQTVHDTAQDGVFALTTTNTLCEIGV